MKTTIDYQTEILAYLQERFKSNLLAIVLFGSRVRQTQKAFSDFDLLIVANDLPREHRRRRQIAALIRRELALPIDATVLTPDAFVSSVRYCAPLMLELANAYEVWFEKDNFFSRQIRFLHLLIQQGKLIQLQPGVWKLPENVDEMARDGIFVSA